MDGHLVVIAIFNVLSMRTIRTTTHHVIQLQGTPLFIIGGNQARRTPTGLANDVRAVEEARAGPILRSVVDEMEKDCGFKGYSILYSQSPTHKHMHPHLK